MKKHIEGHIGQEIRNNLDHLSAKLEIIVKKPAIYKEPDDPNDIAIDRLERARNISFEMKVYDATLSSSSSMGSALEITDFYSALGMTSKYETCVLSIDKAERFPMNSYAWQRTQHVKQLYVTAFMYGAELLTDRLHQSAPSPPSDLADEITKIQTLTRVAARETKTSALHDLKVSLEAFEPIVTKCEEFKSRLP